MNGFMKNSQKILAIALLVAGTAFSQSALALPGFSLGVVGVGGQGVNSLNASVLGATVTVSPGLAFGAGVAAEIGPLSAELIYMVREVTVKTEMPGFPTLEGSTYGRTLDLPVMFRFGAGGVSLGAGGYLQLPTQSGGETSYGLTAGARVKIPGGLFGDARVNYSLKSVDMGTMGTYTPIEALALVGFNFL